MCIFVDGKSLFKFFYAGFEDFILLFKQSILFFKLFDDFNLIIAHLSPPPIRKSLLIKNKLFYSDGFSRMIKGTKQIRAEKKN